MVLEKLGIRPLDTVLYRHARKVPGGPMDGGDAPPAVGDQWPPLIHPQRGALPVEIHRRVTYRGSPELITSARRLPIDALPGLTRATGAATFEAYPRHCVVTHALRRGHLREVMLLAAVWEECTHEERDRVVAAVESDAAAPALAATFAAVRAVAVG